METQERDPLIDFTTAVGKRAQTQLATEQVVWSTTVGEDTAPHPSPVWFLWDGETVLVFSRPDAPKVRNVAHNPHVALNFRGDSLVLSGQATIAPKAPRPDSVAAYFEKYRDGIARLGMTADAVAATYATALRVRPTRVRGN